MPLHKILFQDRIPYVIYFLKSEVILIGKPKKKKKKKKKKELDEWTPLKMEVFSGEKILPLAFPWN